MSKSHRKIPPASQKKRNIQLALENVQDLMGNYKGKCLVVMDDSGRLCGKPTGEEFT